MDFTDAHAGATAKAVVPATWVRRMTRSATRAATLAPAAAFYLQASMTLSFLAGSSAPTPLYPVYQAEWGFSSITVTLVFAVYAVAVLGSLLVMGRLSDHVGRRPVLVASAVLQVVAMLVLAGADGVAALFIGRIVQGLSTGAAVAAVGAGLLDIDPTRGATANAIAPILGTAVGGLLAGLMVRWLPAPAQLVYLVLAGIFVVQLVGVVCMPETAARLPGALLSLRPRFGLPMKVRRQLRVAAPVLIAAWALAGFYASLGPSVVTERFALDASLYGGMALFVFAGSGAAAVLMLQKRDASAVMSVGAWALLGGTGIVMAALQWQSTCAFVVGTTLAGAGFGAGFQGAIRSVVTLTEPHERAGTLSVVFVIAYLSMGIPAVVAGTLIARGAEIGSTAIGFAGMTTALAASALLGTVLEARRQRRPRGSNHGVA